MHNLGLIDHLEEHNNSSYELPQHITADAGYGREQNYTYLEENDVEAFVKYNYFHKEQKQLNKKWLPINLYSLSSTKL